MQSLQEHFFVQKTINLRTCYIIMNNKKLKDSKINLRINKQDKEELIKKAHRADTNVSSYILETLEKYDQLQKIPDAVFIWQSYNEILRVIRQYDNETLLKNVEEIIYRYLQNNNNL